MLQALVFDFDGVILESFDLKVRVFRDLFAAHPAEQDRIARLYVESGGMPKGDQLALVYPDVLCRPLADAERARLDTEARRRVADEILTCPFVPGMPAFLERRSRELPLFVASGAPEDDLRSILTRRGLRHLFRGIHGAPRPKPARDAAS